jgi:ABC-type antimicrobial peptide transport system permease subunit
VAIVTETFVQKFLPGQNPIGKTFSYEVGPGEPQATFEIVGLAKASKYYHLREDFMPIAFFPQTQDARPDPEAVILMRSRLPLDDLIPSLRHTVQEVDRNIDFAFRNYERSVRERLLSERLLATLSGFFGLLAGVLATVGLYGVIAYTVVQRTNEIGIRMALGAAPRSITGMIVREAVKLLGLGLLLGALLSLAAGKAAAALLFGLKPDDPLTLAAAALALAVITVGASMLPATRAARLDPMVALRQE